MKAVKYIFLSMAIASMLGILLIVLNNEFMTMLEGKVLIILFNISSVVFFKEYLNIKWTEDEN